MQQTAESIFSLDVAISKYSEIYNSLSQLENKCAVSWNFLRPSSDKGQCLGTIQAMADQIIHRGPNDVGFCEEYPVFLVAEDYQ